MRAVVFEQQLQFVTDYPEPSLRPGEALIRPNLVGICNTDLELTRGYMGFHGVLGHEFVGTVVAASTRAWVGQRVVGEINAACRQCATCRRGDDPHCPNRTTLGIDRRDGVMADLFCLPEACLLPVPPTLPDEAAVFAEPLAAALEILQQTHVQPTATVAVVGDGKLGAMIVQALRLPGCAVSLIGRHPERWALFEQQGTRCYHSDDPPQHQFDVVVDCTGNPSGLATARRLVRSRGRLVLKSTFHGEVALDLSMFVVDEIQVVSSRCGPFAPALRLLEQGLIETAPLVSASYALDDALAAFAATPGALKVLLRVGA